MILIRLIQESVDLASRIESKFIGTNRSKKPNVISRWPAIYDKVNKAMFAKKW